MYFAKSVEFNVERIVLSVIHIMIYYPYIMIHAVQ